MYPLVLHGAFLQDAWISIDDCAYINLGINIAFPRSGGILEGISYQSTISYVGEVTIELPLNWYKNNGLLGFALFCVYGKSNDLPSVGHLTIKGNDEEKSLDSFSLGYSNLDLGKSNTTWIMCYPKVAIKERYRSNQWTHIRATFYGEVEGCGIHLIYAKDDEQMQPSMVQGISSQVFEVMEQSPVTS